MHPAGGSLGGSCLGNGRWHDGNHARTASAAGLKLVAAPPPRRRIGGFELGAAIVLLEDDFHRALEHRARRTGFRRQPGIELMWLHAQVIHERFASALQGSALLENAGTHFGPAWLLFHVETSYKRLANHRKRENAATPRRKRKSTTPATSRMPKSRLERSAAPGCATH